MKRFLLFGSTETHYAAGGAADFLGDFEYSEDARKFARDRSGQDELAWWHVLDQQERRVSFQYGTAYNQGRISQDTERVGTFWNFECVPALLP